MKPSDKKESLIENLISEGYLKTNPVIKAMREIPRENFVLPDDRDFAYIDRPLPIGYGQTISAPHMVAIMTEELHPEKSDIILEIGGGSGYQAAVLSSLVKKIISVELEKELSDFARDNLKKTNVKNVEIIHGDGSETFPGKFDKIIVSCGSDKIYPEWEKQLKEGGFMIIPLNNRSYQTLFKITKTGNSFKKERILDCSFVLLRH